MHDCQKLYLFIIILVVNASKKSLNRFKLRGQKCGHQAKEQRFIMDMYKCPLASGK
jgi:hypothetical protein